MTVGGQSSPSPSHLPNQQRTVDVLIIVELAMGCRWGGHVDTNFCPRRNLNLRPESDRNQKIDSLHPNNLSTS